MVQESFVQNANWCLTKSGRRDEFMDVSFHHAYLRAAPPERRIKEKSACTFSGCLSKSQTTCVFAGKNQSIRPAGAESAQGSVTSPNLQRHFSTVKLQMSA